MENKYYSGRNFNSAALANSIIASYGEELEAYKFNGSEFAFSQNGEKRSLVVIVSLCGKIEKTKEKYIVFDILAQEKKLFDEKPHGFKHAAIPFQIPEILENEYVYCELRYYSLVIGCVRHDGLPQSVEEAQKMCAAYLFSGPFYLHEDFWNQPLPLPVKINGGYMCELADGGKLKITDRCFEF